MAAAKGTPMMAQYQTIKDQNPDALLFFRLGDFYELFGDDAKEASQLLGITLTARTSGEGRSIRVPMAGVPYHAAPGYIQRLLKAGKKVAICEQMEDPQSAKGMMRRELVRVVTPGTTVDEAFLDRASNNYVAALCQLSGQLGLAWADNTTGEFVCAVLPAEAAGLEAELQRLLPAELLVPDQGLDPELLALAEMFCKVLSPCESYLFEASEAERRLKAHFGVLSLDGFGLNEAPLAQGAAGALLAYLLRTQRSALSHLGSLRLHHSDRHLRMDAAALRHLEVVQNLEDGGRSHTLFSVVDHGATSAGSRLLKRWLQAPLLDLSAILERQAGVAALVGDGRTRERLRESLGLTADLERVLGKIGCLTAGPRDLVAIRQTLQALPALAQVLTGLSPSALRAPQAEDLNPLLAELERALVDEPPAFLREGGIFKAGYDAELDQALSDSLGARETVLAIQDKERERSGNPKLKVQFNNIFGYYIEVTKAQASIVPSDYERKQTLVGAERFTTPELKTVEQRVLGAQERKTQLEIRFFNALRDKISLQARQLQAVAQRLAELDAVASFAEAASKEGWTRPSLDESVILDIQAGRHPVIEPLLRAQGQTFVPNDCLLDADTRQLLLITGPNMAGKSTYMRQTALLVLLAQCGSFVPAAKARVGLVDRIFTRVGASDRMSRGMSTFLVEMTETANILHHATRRSLVVLDEIGRGTSTYDGVSIAWAVAEHLHESSQLGCRSLFATHYFELAELEQKLARVKNVSVAVKEWQGKIVFLHSIQAGPSEHSYGIAVAKLAGVPEAVLKRAREVLLSLEASHRANADRDQMDLFQAKAAPVTDALRERLLALEPNAMTPLQALQELQALRQELL